MKKLFSFLLVLILVGCSSTTTKVVKVESSLDQVVEIEDDTLLENEKVVESQEVKEIIEETYEVKQEFLKGETSYLVSKKTIQEYQPKKVRVGTKSIKEAVETIIDKEIEVVYEKDETLDKGIEKVVQEGQLGKQELRYQETYIKGVLSNRELIDIKVIEKPQKKIIKVGTKMEVAVESKPVEPAPTTNFSQISNKDLSWWYQPGSPKATIRSDIAALLKKYNAIWQIPTSEKVVYLTFDEGYEYGNNTSKILDTLKNKNVKATFFITGGYYDKNTALVKRMVSEGHQVANHTVNHYRAAKAINESEKKYINDVLNLEKKVPGLVKLHRPPEDGYSERSLAILKSLGYKTVFWSFAYKDWVTDAQPDVGFAKEKILSNVHPGSILLIHAVSNTNTQILGDVIDGIKAKGYQIRLLSTK